MKKEYSINNGRIVTSHINRKGEEVDVREIEGLKFKPIKGFSWMGINVVDTGDLIGKEVEVLPPKGQEIDPLILKIEREVWVQDPKQPLEGVVVWNVEVFASIGGIHFSLGFYPDTNGYRNHGVLKVVSSNEEIKALKEEKERKEAKRREEWREKLEKEKKERIEKNSLISPKEVVQAVKPVWSHLREGKGEKHYPSMINKLCEAFGAKRGELPSWILSQEEFFSILLKEKEGVS